MEDYNRRYQNVVKPTAKVPTGRSVPLVEASSSSSSKAMKSNKFADLGATNYTSTNKDNTRIGRLENSVPKAKSVRKDSENDSLEEDASSDELNLTDSSAPIESPIKRSRSNNKEAPWLRSMTSMTRQRVAAKPTSKAKSNSRHNNSEVKNDRTLKAGQTGDVVKRGSEGVLVNILKNGRSSNLDRTPTKGKQAIRKTIKSDKAIKPTLKPHPLAHKLGLLDKDEDKSDMSSVNDCSLPTRGAEVEVQAGLQPFPMLPDFQKSPKGISESGSDNILDSSKKNRTSRLSFDCDFSFTQTQIHLDPATLCPFCDMLLPSEPSPALSDMLKRLQRSSRPDPRPTNALGRKAPFTSYIDLCQRHQFETTLLPEARSKGWPTVIDFDSLPKRIQSLKNKLSLYIASKESSRFWLEFKSDIETKGARKALGINGQFNTFDRCLPGYYGEQGSTIISQILYDLFPPEAVDTSSISPLSLSEFIQRILVPEVAVELIKEDMGYNNNEEAVETLRESSKYGTLMFPDQETRTGIGDNIVRSRARARRRQAEEEIRMDEEIERLTSEDDGPSSLYSDGSINGSVLGASGSTRMQAKAKSPGKKSMRHERTASSELSDASVPSSEKNERDVRITVVRDLDATPRVRPRPKFKGAIDRDAGSTGDVTPKATRNPSKKHDVSNRSPTSSLFEDRRSETSNSRLSQKARKRRAKADFIYNLRDAPSSSSDSETGTSRWLFSEDN